MAQNSIGKAVLSINLFSDNIQVSNFGSNSFKITNTGQKNIAQVEIDVTNALYPDSVFDPFGLAGDTATKPLQINTNGGTGIIAPSNASYIGLGGTAGYEGLRLIFDSNVNGGFQPGETLGFSIDMDPNSVAGTLKNPLDAGTSPAWDAGGVSGAELIGSTFTVTFTDGTTATGQLHGANNQGGSKGLAAQDSPNLSVNLSVNGLGAGGIGTYDASGPTVILNGPAGQTARVVLTKGFIQPVNPYAQFLADQLAALAETDFPANNAVEFQTVDVVLTGANQNISNLFDFSGVAAYDFVGEDQLPLGFVASVIDPGNSDLPLGPVTQPIYLEFADSPGPQNQVSIAATQNAGEPSSNGLFTVSLAQAVGTNTVVNYSVGGTATAGADYTTLSGSVTILAGQTSATIPVSVLDDTLVEGNETVVVTLTGANNGVVLGTTQATVTIVDNDQPAPTSFTVEAESITNVTGYRIENNLNASGGSMRSLVGGANGETGTASFTFNGITGAYNIYLGTFDENDGVATLQVAKGSSLIGSVVLDQQLGGNGISSATKVERLVTTAGATTLSNGDTITVTGFENGGEHARFDFIRFEAASAPVNTVSVAATQNAGEPSSNGLFTVSLAQAVGTNTVVNYSVGGTATAGADYTPLSGSVTILAGQTSAAIPVAVLNDSLVEGNESVIVTLTGISGSANVGLGESNSATVTLADNDVSLSPVTFEAEGANNITNYRIENIWAASGGQVLGFAGGGNGETGSATFNFGSDQLAGTYDIVLGAFDENDGLASFTVELSDGETGITTQIGTLVMDANLGSGLANTQTKFSATVATGISLTVGDSITVTGFEEGGEHARLDFLQLVPTI